MKHGLLAGLFLSFTVGLVALPGCGGGVGAYCEAACQCSACTEAEFARCMRDGEEREEEYAYTECGGFYSDLLSCIDSKNTCRNHDFDHNCNREEDQLDDCLSNRHN
jgi:hypothetical protein